jgi:hypothetical protein
MKKSLQLTALLVPAIHPALAALSADGFLRIMAVEFGVRLGIKLK